MGSEGGGRRGGCYSGQQHGQGARNRGRRLKLATALALPFAYHHARIRYTPALIPCSFLIYNECNPIPTHPTAIPPPLNPPAAPSPPTCRELYHGRRAGVRTKEGPRYCSIFPAFPPSCPEAYRIVTLHCLQRQPQNRPPAEAVVRHLESLAVALRAAAALRPYASEPSRGFGNVAAAGQAEYEAYQAQQQAQGQGQQGQGQGQAAAHRAPMSAAAALGGAGGGGGGGGGGGPTAAYVQPYQPHPQQQQQLQPPPHQFR